MKKIVPIAIALVIFVAAIILIQPPASSAVVVAAVDMPAGHVIADADLMSVHLPAASLPGDIATENAQLVGQTLMVERAAGDMIRKKHLGEPIKLQPNERAMALTVKDNSGLAGLLKVGDMVGVNALIHQTGNQEDGSFSKAAVENLRVLYISPNFSAAQPQAQPTSADGAYIPPTERATTGTVVLAIPTDNKALIYDFEKGSVDTEVHNQYRTLNAIELLAALNASGEAELYLYLMPKDAQPFTTTGLWVPDLVVRAGATATPTPLPGSIQDLPATPTPLPAAKP